jgi:hypothetical protein
MLVAAAMFFVGVSLTRFIARDEGYYLLAARLVSQGQVLYGDFFYPQMPLLPLIYGVLFKLAGPSWEVGRLFTGALATGCAFLVALHLLIRRGVFAAMFGVLLLCTSQLVFSWYSTSQTYSLSVFLLLMSYVCVEHAADRKWLLALSGFALGLAISSRLPMAGLFPVFLYLLWRQQFQLRIFLIGLGIGLLPTIAFALFFPESFWFSNVVYHMLRSEMEIPKALQQKAKIIRVLIGIEPTKKFSNVQFPLLLFFSLGYALFARRMRISIDGAWFIATALLLIHLLPTPTYVQYFCVAVPFLVICTTLVVDLGVKRLLKVGGRNVTRVATALSGLALGLYLVQFPLDLEQYLVSAQGVMGTGPFETRADWTLKRLQQVSRRLDTLTDQGDLVLALWPGYLAQTHAKPLPGTENPFGRRLVRSISEQHLTQFRIMSKKRLRESVEKEVPRVVVLHERKITGSLQQQLMKAGYRVRAREGSIRFYKRRE